MPSAAHPDSAAALERTPLHALHLELGARMVPFAGYDMPVQYPDGILKEHLHCRAAAGLFDVSHMGQAVIAGADRVAALEALVPGDVAALRPGRMRYTMFTDDRGRHPRRPDGDGGRRPPDGGAERRLQGRRHGPPR